MIRISREAKIPAEVYHIKAAGKKNWPKLDALLARIEAAQKEGLKITADMYTYTAGRHRSRCLLCRRGRKTADIRRFSDGCAIRRRAQKIAAEVKTPSDEWENLYLAAGSPEKILLVGFKSEKLKPLTGKPWPKWQRCAAKIRSRRSWI